MKWLAVGVWFIGVYSVLYYIEIKTSVIFIPETIVIKESESAYELQTSTEESEYSGVEKVNVADSSYRP